MFKENSQTINRTLKNVRILLAVILENIYLILFGIVVFYLFLQKTAFEIPWKAFMRTEDNTLREWCRWLLEPPYNLLGYVAVLRCLIQKEYRLKRTLLALGIFFCGRELWQHNSYFKIMLLTLLLVGALGISFRKMIKVYFLLISTALLITFGCAVTGVIENYVLMRGENMRMFFGINSPTNFASFVFFQILCWWYLRKEKLTYIEAAVVAGISVFLMVFCNTRTACALLIVLAICMCWMRFRYMQAETQGKQYRMNSVVSALSALSHPLLAGFMIVLTLLYTSDSSLFVKMNTWLSDRLGLGWRAFDVYGISWLGQYVPTYAFSDGEAASNYFCIDSSYVQMPIVYGLAAMIFLLAAFLWIGCRAVEEKDWIFLLILVFTGVHSAIEPHLLEVQYCPFLLALLADTTPREGLRIREIFGRK